MSKGKVVATLLNETDLICEYGCGKKANFRFTNGRVCCSDIHTKCESFRKHSSERNFGKANTGIPFDNIDKLLCQFGCGQLAKYKFKHNKLCCEKYVNSCKSVKGRMSKSMSGKTSKGNKFENNSGILCEFGCGQLAQYKFELGKYCCSEIWESCPEARLKNTKTVTNKWREPDFRNLITQRINDSRDEDFSKLISKQKFSEWKNPNSLLNSPERNKKLSKSQKMGLDKLTKKYPDFIKDRKNEVIEDEETRKIMVKCDCCEKWFIPEGEYLYEATFRSSIKSQNFPMLCSYECFIKMGIEPKKWSYTDEYKKFKEYSNEVIKETGKTLRRYGNKIKNLHLRGTKFGYELDHRFTIINGFKLGVDIQILAHWKNLEIITREENRKKLGKSSISLEELLTEIKNL